MSHFTRLRTQITEKAYLVEALRDLGYQPVEGDIEVRGYHGATTRAEIVVPTQSPGYDIGFLKVGDTYECVADWWGIKECGQQEFLHPLLQRYAYRATCARLAEQGFEIAAEEVDETNTIHLTLRRIV